MEMYILDDAALLERSKRWAREDAKEAAEKRKSKSNQLLDQLAMLMMGSKGNKEANLFLEDCARLPLKDAKDVYWYNQRRDSRLFIPPKKEDRIIMFSDGSGVYVHKDGFCTPMGEDIRQECEFNVNKGDWVETHR
jgi:hypothetical protein